MPIPKHIDSEDTLALPGGCASSSQIVILSCSEILVARYPECRETRADDPRRPHPIETRQSLNEAVAFLRKAAPIAWGARGSATQPTRMS